MKMSYATIQLDPCIFYQHLSNGIIILNPITNVNEIIFYPLNIEKMYYYQTLVTAYYKIIVGQLIANQEKNVEDDSTDLEEIDTELIRLKRENERLKQKSRDVQRHNQILQRDLIKMNSDYQPPKFPKMLKPGTVTFPIGFEVDETLDIQFGYN